MALSRPAGKAPCVLPPVHLFWTHLPDFGPFERTLLLGVGGGLPASGTAARSPNFPNTWASVLAGPPPPLCTSLCFLVLSKPVSPAFIPRNIPPLPAAHVAATDRPCRKVQQGRRVWRGLGCPPSCGVLSRSLWSPVRSPAWEPSGCDGTLWRRA